MSNGWMDGWMDGLTEQDALTIHSGCVPQKRRKRKSHQSSSRTLTNYPENYFGVRQAHLPQQGQDIVDNLQGGIQRTGVTSIGSGNSGEETFPQEKKMVRWSSWMVPHLGLFQFVKSSLQTLQNVDDDFDVVLVLLKDAFDFRQDLPPNRQVVHVLVHVDDGDQGCILWRGSERPEDDEQETKAVGGFNKPSTG